MYLELDGNGVLYRQLLRALKRAILDGRLPAGAQLPATRALATQLGLARNTVLTAYDLLCAEHLAVSRGGSGTFVAQGIAAKPRRASPVNIPAPSRYAARARDLPPLGLRIQSGRQRLDLQYGEPLIDLPLFTAWGRELSRAAVRTEARYPGSHGASALRAQIASYLGRRRGINCDADDIVIVSGSQQAISLVGRLLLNEGERAVLEDPHYQLAAQCLAADGADLSFVAVDRDGLRVSDLPSDRISLVFVTPSHQFPSGAVMSVPRRLELLEQAASRRFWIVEDDYDGEFGFEGRMIPALRSLDLDDKVIYIGSFSKTLFPALRLGYVVCPRALREDLIRAKLLADLGCGGIEQTAMAHFMESGAFDRYLRKASIEIRRRRRVLVEGLSQHCDTHLVLDDTGAGMHSVGWLPDFDHRRFAALLRVAEERGLRLHPIAPHYARPPSMPGLLLGFAGLSVAQLRQATRILGECLTATGRMQRRA